ncbi:membrane-associated protein, putative [Bodo saltans]|uniref:Membrane-associated protein, putative n=1 Tax=Bodo saltans TaxID=75058 RepID=A0A0S4J8W4_BODSA|nr:membrane-associated protein, putative [Bodo saltans]|eukprot:CUG83743.1 membrane-associated protein, putative [Bodo saltans]
MHHCRTTKHKHSFRSCAAQKKTLTFTVLCFNVRSLQLLLLATFWQCCSFTHAVVPLAPFGNSAGDTQLTPNTDDQSFGPFPLPYPIPFPDGSAETSYYASSNGLISFTYVSSYTLSPTYVASQGRLIAAAYGDLRTPVDVAGGGMYHRAFTGSAPQLRSLWHDVLTTIPFSPTCALVFTVYNCPRFGSPSDLITAQTIILWNKYRMLILFRVRAVGSSTLLFGGYVGPMWTWVYTGDSTLWPTKSNVSVPGLFVATFPFTTPSLSDSVAASTSRTSTASTDVSTEQTLTQSISASGISLSGAFSCTQSLSSSLSQSTTRVQTSTPSMSVRVPRTASYNPSTSSTVSYEASASRTLSPTQERTEHSATISLQPTDSLTADATLSSHRTNSTSQDVASHSNSFCSSATMTSSPTLSHDGRSLTATLSKETSGRSASMSFTNSKTMTPSTTLTPSAGSKSMTSTPSGTETSTFSPSFSMTLSNSVSRTLLLSPSNRSLSMSRTTSNTLPTPTLSSSCPEYFYLNLTDERERTSFPATFAGVVECVNHREQQQEETPCAPPIILTELTSFRLDTRNMSSFTNLSLINATSLVSTDVTVILLVSPELPAPRSRITIPYVVPLSWTLSSVGNGTNISMKHTDQDTIGNISTVLASGDIVGYDSVTNITLDARCTVGGGGAGVAVTISILWPPRPVPRMSDTTIALTSTTAALNLLAGGSDVSSAVSVVMMSLLVCSDKPPSVSVATYFVSVFFDLGNVAMALGNIGVAVTAIGLHILFAWSIVKCTPQLRSAATANDNNDEQLVSRHCSQMFDDVYLPALARCRCPSWGLRFMSMLLPGSVLGGVAGVIVRVQTGAAVDVGGCVVALVCVGACDAGEVILLQQFVLKRVVYQPYRVFCIGTEFEQRFLFPTARWEPVELHHAFNPLISTMRSGCSLIVFAEPLLSCWIAAVSGSFLAHECHVSLLAIAAALHFLYAATVVVLRPHRFPSDRLLVPLVYVLLGTTCALRYAEDPASPSEAIDKLQSTVSVLQLLKSLCSMFVAFYREPALRNGDAYEPPILSAIFDRKDAMQVETCDEWNERGAYDSVNDEELALFLFDIAANIADDADLGADDESPPVRPTQQLHTALPFVAASDETFVPIEENLFWDGDGNALVAVNNNARTGSDEVISSAASQTSAVDLLRTPVISGNHNPSLDHNNDFDEEGLW